MVNFFKNFAKGVLYVLVLPALLVVLVLYAVAGLFMFIYLGIKGLVLFFTGRSLYEDLPEDKEAKRRLGILPPEPKEEVKEQTINVAPSSAQEVEQNNEEEDIVSSDPFYVPEYLRTPEQQRELDSQKAVEEANIPEEKIEPKPEPKPEINPQPIMTEHKEEIIEEKPIIEEKTSQNANIFSISDVDDMDDSDDDNHSGINIDFE